MERRLERQGKRVVLIVDKMNGRDRYLVERCRDYLDLPSWFDMCAKTDGKYTVVARRGLGSSLLCQYFQSLGGVLAVVERHNETEKENADFWNEEPEIITVQPEVYELYNDLKARVERLEKRLTEQERKYEEDRKKAHHTNMLYKNERVDGNRTRLSVATDIECGLMEETAHNKTLFEAYIEGRL